MELEENRVDVSGFLLVEYSADSEASNDLSESSEPSLCSLDDDDDAESYICSYAVSDLDWEGEELDPKTDGVVPEYVCGPGRAVVGIMSEDEEGDADEEDGMVWGEYGVGLGKEEMDGTMEDRVFWETCMAVGYPMN